MLQIKVEFFHLKKAVYKTNTILKSTDVCCSQQMSYLEKKKLTAGK